MTATGSFLGGGLFGLGIGLVLVLSELRGLTRRIAKLERDNVVVSPPPDTTASKATGTLSPNDPKPLIDDRIPVTDKKDIDKDLTLQPDGYRPQPVRLSREQRPLPPIADSARQKKLNPVVDRVKHWFGTGNVPVKVGVIVSFFGIAFLLKYAVERNLLDVPMWLRLVFAVLFGVVLLIIGWRLRKRMRVYALSLQGGGVGIIYLSIFAAFRLYGLLPPVPAFVLLALITVPAAMLAVVQDARAMAVLAVTGGFLAPILTSTGQGSHVALFSYYLMLNLTVVGIAWFKSWRELNLAGFLFTFVIGTAWGYKYYRPEYFASTEPFLIAHFLLYQATAILFAFRQSPRLRGIVDGTLIFGTPIIAFGLQAALTDHIQDGLTYTAVALAVFYLIVAWWLHGRDKAMNLLRDSYVALGIAFATVAVPLALDSSWTAATWAMEGAGLVWLSVRQGRLLSRISGVGLIGLAGASFLVTGWDNSPELTVLNSNVLGGVLVSLAGFFSAWNLGQIRQRHGRSLALALFVWGMVWWFATGLNEIDALRHSFEFPTQIAFLSLSAVVLSFAGRRLDWVLARFGSLVLVPLLVMILPGHSRPFETYTVLPWMFAAVAHLYIVKSLETNTWPGRVWHVAGILMAATLFAWDLNWLIVVDTWSNAAISLMLTLIAMFCLIGKSLFRWPLDTERFSYVTAAGLLLAANLLFIIGFSLGSAGTALPLIYLPLLNPYTVVAIAALLAGFFWISLATDVYGHSIEQKRFLQWLLAAAVFVLSTIAIVRGVHHFADVAWRYRTLARSVEVQSALSIYWGLLGFGAMVLGARREQRWLWLVGSGLMALVVIKLFLVDLGNSGTVARIVSFIGVGALLLVVGYFAPAPPRNDNVVENEG